MTQINLLKHRGLSFAEFKAWLNQLIVDKKGALPDFNDWKLIKEKLDRVHVPTPNVVFSGSESGNVSQPHFRPLLPSMLESPGCSVTMVDECEEALGKFGIPETDWIEMLDEDELFTMFDEFFSKHIEIEGNVWFNGIGDCTPIQAAYYNGEPVTLEEWKELYETEETDNNN